MRQLYLYVFCLFVCVFLFFFFFFFFPEIRQNLSNLNVSLIFLDRTERVEVLPHNPRYIRSVFTTKLMKYRDDVEFLYNAEKKVCLYSSFLLYVFIFETNAYVQVEDIQRKLSCKR